MIWLIFKNIIWQTSAAYVQATPVRKQLSEPPTCSTSLLPRFTSQRPISLPSHPALPPSLLATVPFSPMLVDFCCPGLHHASQKNRYRAQQFGKLVQVKQTRKTDRQTQADSYFFTIQLFIIFMLYNLAVTITIFISNLHSYHRESVSENTI